MKKFSIRLLMLAALVSIACSAYSPKTTHHLTAAASSPAAAAKAATKVDQCYFWFMEPGDYLDIYDGLSVQIAAMESFTGGLITTQPLGGVLVELGYSLPTLPHQMNAQIGLYLHL